MPNVHGFLSLGLIGSDGGRGRWVQGPTMGIVGRMMVSLVRLVGEPSLLAMPLEVGGEVPHFRSRDPDQWNHRNRDGDNHEWNANDEQCHEETHLGQFGLSHPLLRIGRSNAVRVTSLLNYRSIWAHA